MPEVLFTDSARPASVHQGTAATSTANAINALWTKASCSAALQQPKSRRLPTRPIFSAQEQDHDSRSRQAATRIQGAPPMHEA
jgi:hypothetical protein